MKLDLDTQDAIGRFFHMVREQLVMLHGLRPEQAAIVVGRNSHSIIGGWNAGRTDYQVAEQIAPRVRKTLVAGVW